MNGLVVLIPIAIGLGLAGLAAFFWALKRGQFDDLDGAAMRVLIDDEDEPRGGVGAAEPPRQQTCGEHLTADQATR